MGEDFRNACSPECRRMFHGRTLESKVRAYMVTEERYEHVNAQLSGNMA